MSILQRAGSIIVNSLLVVILIGLLGAYFLVVNTLPAQVYTTAQEEFLNYNKLRSVSQMAPVLNILQANGQPLSAILPGRESRVRATLAARYEEQAGVSVTVYDLNFHGEYQLLHTGPATTSIELFFPFPTNLETLHEVRFLVDGEEPAETQFTTQGISWQTQLKPKEKHLVTISYQADGANTFTYGLPQEQRSDVEIIVTVKGLTGSEIPRASLPPTGNKTTDGTQVITWQYSGLIADRDIQLHLPTRLSFAQRVAQLQTDFQALAGLAPVLVTLFMVSLAGVFQLSGRPLGVTNYLLAGLGLAFFYPALTFLSGVVDVRLAAGAATLVIGGLLLIFLSLVAGRQQIRWRVGLLLLIFLGIFSLGMLTPWRGLLLTLGGLAVVSTFMVLYARRPRPEPELKTTFPPVEASVETEPAPDFPPVKDSSPPLPRFCPYCARPLADDHSFCPGCGHDTQPIRRCPTCDQQQLLPANLETVYCLNCGHIINET